MLHGIGCSKTSQSCNFVFLSDFQIAFFESNVSNQMFIYGRNEWKKSGRSLYMAALLHLVDNRGKGGGGGGGGGNLPLDV